MRPRDLFLGSTFRIIFWLSWIPAGILYCIIIYHMFYPEAAILVAIYILYAIPIFIVQVILGIFAFIVFRKPTKPEYEKTSIGIPQNVAGLLSYLLVWISGLVFILLERRNKFVRTHALRSIIIFGILTVAYVIQIIIFRSMTSISIVIVGSVGLLFDAVSFLLWIGLMIMALRGEK